VATAAAQAAARPGSEVAGSEAPGKLAARRGPWAQLRRRRPRTPVAASPELAVPLVDESDGPVRTATAD
jgi:hypothetical protein